MLWYVHFKTVITKAMEHSVKATGYNLFILHSQTDVENKNGICCLPNAMLHLTLTTEVVSILPSQCSKNTPS